MKEIEQVFESFRPVTQFLITFGMWVFGNINIITSVLALAVLFFQLKVVYYNSKLKKAEYDKVCKEE